MFMQKKSLLTTFSFSTITALIVMISAIILNFAILSKRTEKVYEQDINMNQNKALIHGLIRFFVTNLIFNTGFLKEDNITIEVYADDGNVNRSFVRNANKNHQTYDDIIYNVFEEIDDVIMFSLGGSFDYANYKHADRKLIIQCPVAN